MFFFIYLLLFFIYFFNYFSVYGYGTLANVLCCLCSLGGAFVLPFAKKHRGTYHVVMSVFMGLAIGTLLSDAVLHLIPEVGTFRNKVEIHMFLTH